MSNYSSNTTAYQTVATKSNSNVENCSMRKVEHVITIEKKS
jgi:hypothetical protein